MANIRIYIANLGKYNEGYLVGEWIDLPATEEEFEELFVRIKVGHYDEEGEYVAGHQEGWSFYEEVAIHDYETKISGLKIHEYDNIAELNELAEELENKDIEEIEAIIEAIGCDLAEAIEKQDIVFYKGYSLEDVAREYFEGCDWDDTIKNYFNYEAWAEDNLSDDHYEVENGVIYIG